MALLRPVTSLLVTVSYTSTGRPASRMWSAAPDRMRDTRLLATGGGERSRPLTPSAALWLARQRALSSSVGVRACYRPGRLESL